MEERADRGRASTCWPKTEDHTHTHTSRVLILPPPPISTLPPHILQTPSISSLLPICLSLLLLTFVLGLLGVRAVICPTCHQGLADGGRLVADVQTALIKANLGGQEGGVGLWWKDGMRGGGGGGGGVRWVGYVPPGPRQWKLPCCSRPGCAGRDQFGRPGGRCRPMEEGCDEGGREGCLDGRVGCFIA